LLAAAASRQAESLLLRQSWRGLYRPAAPPAAGQVQGTVRASSGATTSFYLKVAHRTDYW